MAASFLFDIREMQFDALQFRPFATFSRSGTSRAHAGSLEAANPSNEETMKATVAAAAISTLVAGSALAQTAEFYVVQDSSTKKCTIVEKKPTTTTTVVVGDGVYKTRTEADTAMKTIKVCS